jgi:ssDNA-binding Zn-finger/Zn-ribbon topoisomerase 1
LKKIIEANEQKVECPHCKKIGGIAIMKRWHFDLCKLSPTYIERKKYTTSQCPYCGLVGGGARMISNHFENCKHKAQQ